MEHGNRVWRYPIRPGADDDPARATFVSEAQARLRAESTAERRREAARRGREAFLAKLRNQGVDIGRYFAELAAKGNAARWRKQSAAAAAAEAAPAPQDAEHGARAEAGPPAIEAATRVTECAPAPPQASESAAAEVVVETRQAHAVAGAQAPQAAAAGVQDTEAPEARQGTPRRTGTLPVYLL